MKEQSAASLPEVLQQWREVLGKTIADTETGSWWIQIGVGVFCIALAMWIAHSLIATKGYQRLVRVLFGDKLSSSGSKAIVFPGLATVLLWTSFHVAETALGSHCIFLRAVALFASAWFLFALTFRLFRGHLGIQVLLTGLILWAIPYILKIHQPVAESLDLLAYEKGDFRLSLRDVLRGIFLFSGLFWIAGVLSRFFEQRIQSASAISRSSRVLLSKVVRVCLIGLACLAVLKLIGVDLSHLAIFSGAFGVAVGFGSQKIISNFVSGIILLIEKSVKPGDFIKVGESFGQVTQLNTRYTTVQSVGNEEHLIPNEELITSEVLSYSHSNNKFNVRAEVGVAYDSDLRQVIRLCKEVMKKNPRVCPDSEPSCLLVDFGDSSINLKLVFTITDPENGVLGVRSEVLLAIWDAFQEHGISIPFPQQEMRVLPPAE